MNKELDLQIKAKNLLEGQIIELSLSQSLFPSEEIELRSNTNLENDFVSSLFSRDEIEEFKALKNSLRLRLKEKSDWQSIAKFCANLLRVFADQIIFDREFIERYQSTQNLDNDQILDKATKLIKEKVSPSLGGHGGDVDVVKFEQGKLFLNFKGGCQGCSQVSSTIKYGIEKILSSEIPQIIEIVDITNHSDGKRPYFS